MKKLLALILSVLMIASMVPAMAATEYDVTEPISITWWHAHEGAYADDMEWMVNKFNAENGMGITVVPQYIGSYTEINTQFIAAAAAGTGTVPALVTCNTSYPAGYGNDGLCEVLDPYIDAFEYDVEDFGEGLIASTSFDGEQICLPYLISTQCIFYNKTAAAEEGITIPTKFEELDEFLQKATLFNEDGTTKRYGLVFGGWDYWYYEMFYKNNGVECVLPDGTTDVNSEKAVAITAKIKEWIDKGYAYYAYGTGASTNMRELFWTDMGAFAVSHTSSMYDTYVSKVGDKFEVGMTWQPNSDGESYKSEVGGSAILIPAAASQAEKNAAWQFLMFMTSPEINLYWADKTGYFPTRQSVEGTPEYEEYLQRKPEMKNIVSMSSWINPRNQNPAYDACANLWRTALYEIFNNNAPIQETLDNLAVEIQENLNDN